MCASLLMTEWERKPRSVRQYVLLLWLTRTLAHLPLYAAAVRDGGIERASEGWKRQPRGYRSAAKLFAGHACFISGTHADGGSDDSMRSSSDLCKCAVGQHRTHSHLTVINSSENIQRYTYLKQVLGDTTVTETFWMNIVLTRGSLEVGRASGRSSPNPPFLCV